MKGAKKPYGVEAVITQGHMALYSHLARGMRHGTPGERKKRGK